MILDFANKWNPGDSIGVSFVNGSEKLLQRVEEVIKIWEQYANIHFDFSSTDPIIKIKFESSSNDSKIGTEYLNFKDKNVNMNFALLNPNSSDEDVHKIILHEFGHALGLVHEHFNPVCLECFDVNAVMNHFKKNVGLNEADIKNNVLRKYVVNQFMFSEFDPHSIMIYDIPSSCMKDGRSFKQPFELSDIDKKFISEIYPNIKIDISELEIDSETEFQFNSPYQELSFKLPFPMPEGKRYYISTTSDQDIALSIYLTLVTGDKVGHIEYKKPFENNEGTVGMENRIEFEDFIPGANPGVTDYYLRISRVNNADLKGTLFLKAE